MSVYLFVETSGGSTHAVIPVQEVAEDRPPAVEPDGVGKISSPIDSTDTGSLIIHQFLLCNTI